MWKFLVKNQSIEIMEREVLADHQIQYVQFRFTFDGDWKRFHKVVQFSQCDETYSIVLGFDGTSCYLPAELHVGAAKCRCSATTPKAIRLFVQRLCRSR